MSSYNNLFLFQNQLKYGQNKNKKMEILIKKRLQKPGAAAGFIWLFIQFLYLRISSYKLLYSAQTNFISFEDGQRRFIFLGVTQIKVLIFSLSTIWASTSTKNVLIKFLSNNSYVDYTIMKKLILKKNN